MAVRITRVVGGGGKGTVSIGTKKPKPPPEADFALLIEFKKGEANPQRVFQAADAMIRTLQKLDRTLCASVDNKIEPIMVLEDIEAGSIRIWLGNQLKRVEDDALKELDWKPLVGKYLVRAKYAVINWTNKDGKDASLIALARELGGIAAETDVRHIPDYAPPPIAELADAARGIDASKAFLLPSDKMSFVPKDANPVDFNLTVRWSPEELLDLAVKDTTKFERMPMTLIVKRPDYLGNAKWDFRHGKMAISAKIEDKPWLKNFQSRKTDVRPGDALKCLVTIEHNYGYDNELVSQDYTVTSVEGVLENRLNQTDFGFPEDKP